MNEIICFLFLLTLLTTIVLRVYLARRQIRHVTRYRQQVPTAFSSITLAEHQKAADYTTTKTRLAVFNMLIDSILLLWLTLGGGLNWLWLSAASMTSNDILRGLLLIFGVMLVSFMVGLPTSLYATFGIEARFGFNRSTPKLYVLDLLKSTLLSVLIGAPLLALILWLMQAMGNTWWLWVWLVWMAFVLLLQILYPTVIAPLFNKFQPLDDGDLRTRIENLLTRNGFASKGVFIMDGSKRSSHGNAYFAGFGRSKRIVFFDTLLKQLTPTQIEAVLAHELGHFRLRHIVKFVIFNFALSLLLLFVLGLLMHAPWFYQGLGIAQPSTAMALILFFLVLPVFTFPLTPIASYLSRRHEYEADAFAAQQSSAADLVTALTCLYKDNATTLTPDPLYSAFYDSHPPAPLRIARLTGEQP